MDEKNIISYKPDLNIRGNTTTSIKGNGAVNVSLPSIKSNDEINTVKSKALKNFIYYSPSCVVNSIEEALKNLSNYLLNVENNLSENQYEISYFAQQSNNEETSKILENNKNDIEFGSNILEAYSYMKTMYDDLNNILKLYMQCIFGENTDTSEVESIIQAYISQIEGYEAKEEYSKINYTSLYYDSKVAYILSDFVSQLDDICYDLSCIDDVSNDVQLDSKSYDLVKKYFNKENNTLSSSLYRCSNCNSEILTAIKNLYLEKQELMNNIEVFANIYNFSSKKDIFYDMQNDSYSELNTSVTNLIKTCMNYNMNYGDIVNSVRNKAEYRKFL